MSAPRAQLGFEHRFIPAVDPLSRRTLLLLHGTGGDENDLLPLGTALDPGAARLSPRGKVLEHGMPRFFRRLAEGVFDMEDLVKRTHELAEFVDAAAAAYGFARDGVIAAGFSNGANIAASLLLLRPGALAGAVLFSPMLPFEPEKRPDLARVPVLIAAGKTDPIARPALAERLATLLQECGADVTLYWQPGGHTIDAGALDAARDWLAAR
jgi:predicted esterase